MNRIDLVTVGYVAEISLDDPRVDSDFRNSPDVARLMSEGYKLYWDAIEAAPKLVRGGDGLERVAVQHALPRQECESASELKRRRFIAQARKHKHN